MLEKHIEEEQLIAKGEKIKFTLHLEQILNHFMSVLAASMVKTKKTKASRIQLRTS
jgi:hypothetical protein